MAGVSLRSLLPGSCRCAGFARPGRSGVRATLSGVFYRLAPGHSPNACCKLCCILSINLGSKANLMASIQTCQVANCHLITSVVSHIKWRLRAPQKIQVKAQPAVNGRPLNKGCNAGLSLLGGSLRARREGIICCVAPLGKDQPFPARRALQLIPSRLA